MAELHTVLKKDLQTPRAVYTVIEALMFYNFSVVHFCSRLMRTTNLTRLV